MPKKISIEDLAVLIKNGLGELKKEIKGLDAKIGGLDVRMDKGFKGVEKDFEDFARAIKTDFNRMDDHLLEVKKNIGEVKDNYWTVKHQLQKMEEDVKKIKLKVDDIYPIKFREIDRRLASKEKSAAGDK